MAGPRRRRSFVALLMVCLLAGAAAAGAEAGALDDARALMMAGERDRARATLDSLLTWSDGEDAEATAGARRLRAELEEDGAAYAASLRELAAAETDPRREASLRLALGKVSFAEGRIEDALTEFRRVRELGREEAGSLWEGICAFALGDGPSAREALERAALSGNRGIRQRALLALGDVERLSGACENAVDRYADARDVEHGALGWWAAAAFAEALCRDELGDGDRAERLLQEILREAPSSYEAPLARARLRAREEAVVETAAVSVAEESGEPAGPAPFTGYAVQVGAFTLSDNAKALAQAVEGRGFTPVRVVRGEDELHRVLVGRFENRDEAEALGDSLGITLGVGFSVVADRED